MGKRAKRDENNHFSMYGVTYIVRVVCPTTSIVLHRATIMRCSGVEQTLFQTLFLGSSDMAALPVLYGSHTSP